MLKEVAICLCIKKKMQQHQTVLAAVFLGHSADDLLTNQEKQIQIIVIWLFVITHLAHWLLFSAVIKIRKDKSLTIEEETLELY